MVDGVGATRFAAMVRFLAAECREAGLEVPAFRSPPRRAGTRRTIRRLRDGAVVAIELRGRGPAAVAEDMIEGKMADIMAHRFMNIVDRVNGAVWRDSFSGADRRRAFR